MVRERIARVRYERTMTMREPKDEKAQGFESLLTEEEKEGLSEEEKMKRIAAKMEERFKSETRRVSTVAVSDVAVCEIVALIRHNKLGSPIRTQNLLHHLSRIQSYNKRTL